MKTTPTTIALGIAFLSLGTSAVTSLKVWNAGPGETISAARSDLAGDAPSSNLQEERLARLEAAIARLQQQPPIGTGDAAPPSNGSTRSIEDRLTSIEASLSQLQQAIGTVSPEISLEERDRLFRSGDGHLKADELFALGSYAVAGEGYLSFLEANPDHPDAYDILTRARRSFQRAGYHEKAAWVQGELLTNLPDRRPSDVLTLAKIEKDAGRYSDAIAHATEAADLATDSQERLWSRMYWAWFNQLRDGGQAGLSAYREVEQEIAAAGFSDGKLGDRVREKIAELEGDPLPQAD